MHEALKQQIANRPSWTWQPFQIAIQNHLWFFDSKITASAGFLHCKMLVNQFKLEYILFKFSAMISAESKRHYLAVIFCYKPMYTRVMAEIFFYTSSMDSYYSRCKFNIVAYFVLNQSIKICTMSLSAYNRVIYRDI